MLGQLDTFIGPGATTAEIILQFGASFLIGFGCWFAYNQAQSPPQQSWNYRDTIVLFLSIDMIGGVVTNATSSAKRWYHRSSQTKWDHTTFVMMHALQIFVVAYFFASTDWKIYFGIVYGGLLLSSVILVYAVPLYLQRPTALALVAGTIPLSLSNHTMTPGLEWFLPLLFLKLLVSHLTYETSFQPHDKLGEKDSNNKQS
jgi:hypothetical protein